jgi:hypothetical protein
LVIEALDLTLSAEGAAADGAGAENFYPRRYPAGDVADGAASPNLAQIQIQCKPP